MKKLFALLMVLAMAFALAIPAMAWVGWDAPEAPEPPEPMDFDLGGVRLEFFASPTATFSFDAYYYAEYNPANKGVVQGTWVRAYFWLVLPPWPDVPKNVQGQIAHMALNFTSTNLHIDKLWVFAETGLALNAWAPMPGYGVSGKVINDTKCSVPMNKDWFDNVWPMEYAFMLTGYSKKTDDVTLTAKLNIGQTKFINGVYTFTTVAGRSYKVEHAPGSKYFYITNTNTGAANTPGVVRFTVDGNWKVTDIAVCFDYFDLPHKRVLQEMSQATYNAILADPADTREVATFRNFAWSNNLDGTINEVQFGGLKYAIVLDELYDYEDVWYYASTNANTAKTIFTLLNYKIDLGYLSLHQINVANWLRPWLVSLFNAQYGLGFYNAYRTAANGAAADYYQGPKVNSGSRAIGPNDPDHEDYLDIFEEVLDALGFEWDGTTKYMHESHFIELFGAGVSISHTLIWKAYTAELLVPDPTTPPQTGDAASIVGFVMIALALLAAAAVVVKKVRT